MNDLDQIISGGYMRIEALSVLLRQALKKVLIIKVQLFSVAIVCACLASAQNVEASSARAQLGFGNSDSNIYSRVNLDLFLYDGTFAPYIGVEGGGAGHDREYCASCNGVIIPSMITTQLFSDSRLNRSKTDVLIRTWFWEFFMEE